MPADLALSGQVKQGLDTIQADKSMPTIAESHACLTMMDARGNPARVIPNLVVNVQAAGSTSSPAPAFAMSTSKSVSIIVARNFALNPRRRGQWDPVMGPRPGPIED
jgi:hypothetical protein